MLADLKVARRLRTARVVVGIDPETGRSLRSSLRPRRIYEGVTNVDVRIARASVSGCVRHRERRSCGHRHDQRCAQ